MKEKDLQSEIDELRDEINTRLQHHPKRGEYLYSLRCCEKYIDNPDSLESIRAIVNSIRQLIKPINLR